MTDTTDTTDDSHGERTHEVTLELNEHAHDQLIEKARRDGESVGALASEIVIDQLSHNDRIIRAGPHRRTGESVYWMLVVLSDTRGVSMSDTLQELVETGYMQLGGDDDTADERGLLARAAEWVSRDSVVEQEYNLEFLTEQEFTYLTADETPNGVELQCRLCGRVFTNEVERCYSHIAGHEEHITENIDPFESSGRRDPRATKAPPAVRTAHLSKRQRERDSEGLEMLNMGDD